MVDRRMAAPVRPDAFDVQAERRGVYVRDGLPARIRAGLLDAGLGQVNVLFRVALGGEVHAVVRDVVGQRATRVVRHALGSGIDRAFAAGAGSVLELAGQAFAEGLVGVAATGAAVAELVGPGDHPADVLLRAIRRGLVDGGHAELRSCGPSGVATAGPQ
ncbi:MAG: hypothetical protein AB7G11_08465 [Phycisphaerales bacterium]